MQARVFGGQVQDRRMSSVRVSGGEPASSTPTAAELPNVLLIDDQPARLLTYESILSGVGVNCIRALSAEEALAKLMRHSFAAILLDISKGTDGFETARLVREHPRFERTPVIFVTGAQVSELDRLKGYEAGAIDYISVPIVPEILRSKVALLVELHRRRAELEALNRNLEAIEHRQVNEDLRRRDLRSRALLCLADQFRSLMDPADLAVAAARVLGETLAIDRCGYGIVDPATETVGIERDWNAPGIESLAGVLALREHGILIDDLRNGETVVCADVECDARTSARSEYLESLRVRAFVAVPILENGTVAALFYLNHSRPRQWPFDEIEFIQDVAERTRATVERRRVERSMQADLEIMGLLRDLAARTVAEDDVQSLFDDILAAAVRIARADAGSLQLLDARGQELYFVSRRGLDPDLTRHFECVSATSGSPCGVALATGERAYVDFDAPGREDADGSSRLHLQFGFRSAQSTPLLSRSGRALGMFSTHWRAHRRLADREWRYLDLLARQAADLIERTQAEKSLRARELELREADKRKDEFIAMLAHELRNPLVPIRTGVELLKRAREQPSLIETIRPMVERQIVHMVRLIDDLLDVSRITSGKIELRRRDASLSSLVGSAIEANRDAIAAAKLELVVSLSDPHVTLHVDPTRFSQILSNLLQNAAKFTPPGGRISVISGAERNPASGTTELLIRVIDTGVGIPQSSIARIFELFAQAGSDGQTSHPGLGIGLTLARRLAELHGGRLEARSEGVDKGSEFILRMPAPEAPPGVQADAEHAPASLAGIAVVVIDDNRDGADIMGYLLQDFGATVDVAYDGLSGLDMVRRVRPAVVLLDIGMPELDGYEVCRRLRREFAERLGIIALTGWGQEQDRRLALEAGFDAHLTKPADPGLLAATIVSILLRSPSA
jgi:signal transduction histidine kinase/DNA-binding response OmpR family regulator